MRRPTVPPIYYSSRREGLPNLVIAAVVRHLAGTNRATIRLSNLSGRSVRDVVVPEGVSLQDGDRVIVARVDDNPEWIILTRILDTSEHGLHSSPTLGRNEMHPPSNFTVTGAMGMVIAQWDAWTGNTVCWEIQHNSSAVETGATTFYTRGSYFIYPSVTAATRYVRVRAVRYDPDLHAAWYSSWTGWASDTSLSASSSGGRGYPQFHVDGSLAAATDVAGAYIFGSAGTIGSVGFHVKDRGSSGRTVVDVNVGGVSIWLLAASQPALYASSPSEYTIVDPDTTMVSVGDLMTVDIDEAATGAVDIDITVHMVA